METKQYVYIGTYSLPIKFGTGEILEGKGKGIYLYEFDTDSAQLKPINVTRNIANPSFLSIKREAAALYAVNELKEYNGEATGTVSAFHIREDGTLAPINQLATGGTDPCHTALSPDGRRLIVCNYMSGSVSVYPVLKHGALGPRQQFLQYEGKGANPNRQEGPHAHSATFSKDGNFVLICDLGTDRVRTYRYSNTDLPLAYEGVEFIAGVGAGPRHAEFGADGRFCYITNEMESTISVAAFSRETGKLTEVQKVSSVPENAERGSNSCADIHIAPDGRFLYASNRGMDSIAIYRIDQASGLLSPAGFEPSGGRTPRSFSLDLTGNFLLCANQDSDNIIVFFIDRETGRLKKGPEAHVPTPVFVKPVVFQSHSIKLMGG